MTNYNPDLWEMSATAAALGVIQAASRDACAAWAREAAQADLLEVYRDLHMRRMRRSLTADEGRLMAACRAEADARMEHVA